MERLFYHWILKFIDMNKQINAFGMAQMSVGLCSLFHNKAIEFINVAGASALHIENKMPLYTQVAGTLASIVNRKRTYITTPELKEKDAIRDYGVGTISSVINAYIYSPVATKKAAAKLLYQEMSPYRGIRDHQYGKETSEINGMLTMLDQEENKAAIATLGLTEEVEALKEANEIFNDVLNKRIQETNVRSEQSQVDTAEVIAEANNLYLEIAQIVNAYAIVQPTDEINAFIDNMNGLVKFAADESGSSTGGTPKPDTPSTPEPVTPEITAVYQKEGGDPENPNRIERGKQTGVKYQGFTLKGADGTLEHVIGLVNDQDYIEWINPETITNVTETSCEFTMVPDLTEGPYKVRIETYDGGSPLVVEYPEPITLW